MQTEVRRVRADWEHPRNEQGYEIPLHGGSYSKKAARWDQEQQMWDEGFMTLDCGRTWIPKDDNAMKYSFSKWANDRPVRDNYMPDWEEGERTHWQLYETVTEGTPLSPVMESPEALAQWLRDHYPEHGSYDDWLRVVNQGWSPMGTFDFDLTTGEISNLTNGVSDEPVA